MIIAQTLPLTLSESEFSSTVVGYAKWRKWLVVHYRPAKTARGAWVTPLEGHPGAPDLLMARAGVVLFAELKRHGEKPRPAQKTWLTALGSYGRLWTPGDWPQIMEELS